MAQNFEALQLRISNFSQQFSSWETWEEKYHYLIDLGKKMPPLAPDQRLDKYLVQGCQSRVWLLAQLQNGKVIYQADSDGAITKGLVALLLAVYSDAAPAEILATPATFLEELGIKNHLSLNRSNGLKAMVKQLMLYAMVLQMPQS